MFGISKGRKTIHIVTEKQMFGKQMFAGCAETKGHRVDSKLCHVFPTTPNPQSLQISLMIALFWKQVLYLNYFRPLGGKVKDSWVFGPWLFSAWNNLHAKRTFWVANFAPLRFQRIREALPLNKFISQQVIPWKYTSQLQLYIGWEIITLDYFLTPLLYHLLEVKGLKSNMVPHHNSFS